MKEVYRPSENAEIYRAYFKKFKNLYLNNKNSFRSSMKSGDKRGSPYPWLILIPMPVMVWMI